MTLIAYLTLAAIIALVLLLVLLLLRAVLHVDLFRFIPTSVLTLLNKHSLWLAFAVALFATLGSLYFSEVQGLAPCQLCWYQRIFMYPLSLMFLIAALRHDKNVVRYALPLSLFGLIIALYQVYIQVFPESALSCIANGISCSDINVNYFGFITIPVMSVVSFLMVIVATILPSLNLSNTK